jgi:hypothetical protein
MPGSSPDIVGARRWPVGEGGDGDLGWTPPARTASPRPLAASTVLLGSAADPSDPGCGGATRPLRWRSSTWPALPLAGALQVAGLIWLYVLYDAARAWLTGSSGVAERHAVQILGVERWLGVGIEHGLQRGVLHTRWLVSLCNLCYSVTHLVVPIVVLVLLYRRAPARYRYWCGVFVAMLGLALVCFWAYPLMPPRLMPAHFEYVDTSLRYFTVTREPLRHMLGNSSTPTPGSWMANNPYAAMPSLHVAWALWALVAAWPVVRSRFARAALALYPAMMAVSVVVTGNHWTLDALGGVALLATSVVLVALVQRLLSQARARSVPVAPVEAT